MIAITSVGKEIRKDEVWPEVLKGIDQVKVPCQGWLGIILDSLEQCRQDKVIIGTQRKN